MSITFIRRAGVNGVQTIPLAAFLRRVAAAARSRAEEVTVVLARDRELQDLNRRYRGRDRATDVLSFGGEPIQGVPLSQGDLVISVDTARRQAAQRHHSLDRELRYLLLHGFLHLMGWDHETDAGEMETEERRLRALLIEPVRRTSGPAGVKR